MPVHLVGPPRGVRGDRADGHLLTRRARVAMRAIGHARSELSIALVDDATIEELNARYRGKSKPTDVLSFSLLDGDHAERRGELLGDVVISVETAAREASARRRGLDAELMRLLVHGLLHLVGYDHEIAADARSMEAEERRVRRAVEDASKG